MSWRGTGPRDMSLQAACCRSGQYPWGNGLFGFWRHSGNLRIRHASLTADVIPAGAVSSGRRSGSADALRCAAHCCGICRCTAGACAAVHIPRAQPCAEPHAAVTRLQDCWGGPGGAIGTATLRGALFGQYTLEMLTTGFTPSPEYIVVSQISCLLGLGLLQEPDSTGSAQIQPDEGYRQQRLGEGVC